MSRLMIHVLQWCMALGVCLGALRGCEAAAQGTTNSGSITRVRPLAPATGQFVTGIDSTGVWTTAGPDLANLGGLGAGVQAALGVSINSNGAVILRGGDAGTPSAINLTNATDLAIPGGGPFWGDVGAPEQKVARLHSDRVFSGRGALNATGAFYTAGVGGLAANSYAWVERESAWLHVDKRMAFTSVCQASLDGAANEAFFGVATGTIAGGSGYADGTYTSTALTGGTGTGARATITVSGGAVGSVLIEKVGKGYVVGNVLSAALPGGSGFTFTVTGRTYPLCIGASAVAINDRLAPYRSVAWAKYIDAVRKDGAGTTFGTELDITAVGSDSPGWSPYGGVSEESGHTIGHSVKCGGGQGPLGVAVKRCSLAYEIGANSASFGAGIGFGAYAVSGVTGQAGTAIGPMILAVAGYSIDWLKPDGAAGARIVSTATGAGVANYTTQEFTDSGVHWLIDGQPRLALGQAGAEIPVVLGATNVELQLLARGTGHVCLGTSSTCRWRVRSTTGDFEPAVASSFNVGSSAAPVKDLYVGATRFTVQALPGTATEGTCVWDVSTHKLKCFDGTAWQAAW